MTHFLGFDGRYKRGLQQNLSRQHTKSGHEIMKLSENERLKRENERRSTKAAITIQACVRGFLSRRASNRYSRQRYDQLLNDFISMTQTNVDNQDEHAKFLFIMLLRCINNFYMPDRRNNKEDLMRLVKMGRLLMENLTAKRLYQEIARHFALDYVYIIGRFIWKVSSTLNEIALKHIESDKATITILLRSLEITLLGITDNQLSSTNTQIHYLIIYLLEKKFLLHLLHLLHEQEMSLSGDTATTTTNSSQNGLSLLLLTNDEIPSYVNRPWIKAVIHLIMSPLRLAQILPPFQQSQTIANQKEDFLSIVIYHYIIDIFSSSSNYHLAFMCCKYTLSHCLQMEKCLLVLQNAGKMLKYEENRLYLANFIINDVYQRLFCEHEDDILSVANLSLTVDYIKLLVFTLQELTVHLTNVEKNSFYKLKGPNLDENDEEEPDGDDNEDMDINDDSADPFYNQRLEALRTTFLQTVWTRCGSLLSQFLSTKCNAENTLLRVKLVSRIFFSLLIIHKQPEGDMLRLVSGLSRGDIISRLWQQLSMVIETSEPGTTTTPSTPPSLLSPKSLSNSLTRSSDDTLHILVTWAFLYYYHLLILDEANFELICEENPDSMIKMVIYLKTALLSIIDIIHSPIILNKEKLMITSAATSSSGNNNIITNSTTNYLQDNLLLQWTRIFQMLQRLFIQMYHRSRRKQLIPRTNWLATRNIISLFKQKQKIGSQLLLNHDFGYFSVWNNYKHKQFNDMNKDECVVRTILTNIPFVIPFDDRLTFLDSLRQNDRMDMQSHVNMPTRDDIIITVRRQSIFEDAYNELLPQNVANLRRRLRVEFRNEAGLAEAGVDGGGLTREFIIEVVKATFDPNRGLFTVSESQHLYPNPTVDTVFPDGEAKDFYFFAGRILGKAIYESLPVDLPLADFFLGKILSSTNTVCDLGYLNDLDAAFCSHLLSMHHWPNVQDLNLVFSAAIDGYGETKTVPLKPNGFDIPVTEENKLEYIYLMTDFKLNKQLQKQTMSFKSGLCDVIDLKWLQLFDPNELQIVISGFESPIDVEDWRSHTSITGSPSSSSLDDFWTVVERFTDDQKRQLLRFVTSCSRPPLFGFRELHPPFTIQFVPLSNNSAASDSQRLPTVSTCMNLLKLPDYGDVNILHDKLLYAISSNAGFELS